MSLKAKFLEERRLIMNWWSRYLEANQHEHISPREFAKQAGPSVAWPRAGHNPLE